MPRPSNLSKYEPPRYASPSPSLLLQQQQHTQRSSSNASLTNGTGASPLPPPTFIKTYMKPLPKLPQEIQEAEESRELSSTDDLSSRPRSPSVSSSDESYSKTTEGEGDEENSPRPTHGRHMHPNHQSFTAATANPLQWLYPCDIQVDLTSPKQSPVDFAQMKAAFDTQSTADESVAAPSTAQNKGESCNSFEYHDKGAAFSEIILMCLLLDLISKFSFFKVFRPSLHLNVKSSGCSKHRNAVQLQQPQQQQPLRHNLPHRRQHFT